MLPPEGRRFRADTFTHSVCCSLSCWAGNMGGARLHLGQRWTAVSPCATTWQQRQTYVAVHKILCHCCCNKQQRGPDEGWKVVFVSRSRPHTVVHSLVRLGVFWHWQVLVWWRQDHGTAAGGSRLHWQEEVRDSQRPGSSGEMNSPQCVAVRTPFYRLKPASWCQSRVKATCVYILTHTHTPSWCRHFIQEALNPF